MTHDETIVAELTPPGTGAIAVVAVRGPRAWSIVRELFTPASGKMLPAEALEPGAVRFGRLGSDQVADEVVLAIRPEWIELQGHGGRAAVEWMLEQLCEHGARTCCWPEFLRRSETHWQVLAAEQLAQTRTERTAAILLDQYNGAFERSLAEIHGLLDAGDSAAARRRLQEVRQYEKLGAHLVEPFRVVLAGPPNVGKSSLINALAGFERSIVAPMPGTTRDVVALTLAFDGWPVELTDTAGFHAVAAGLEEEGIARARAAVAEADLCVWVLDASAAAPVWPDPEFVNRPLLLVVNKCDLAPEWDLSTASAAVQVSALTKAGLPTLVRRIVERLVPASPSAGSAVPFHPACSEYLHDLDVKTA